MKDNHAYITSSELKLLFDRFDRNNDGIVTFNEVNFLLLKNYLI